jgi:hypothetical protein
MYHKKKMYTWVLFLAQMMAYSFFVLTQNDEIFILFHDSQWCDDVSIYIKKNVCLSVCLFVRYASSPCNSYRHQTFHDTSLGPEEGWHGVGITKKGQEGVPGWNFTQMTFILIKVTKLFMMHSWA